MQRREAEGPRAKQGPVDLWTQATNDVWAYGRVEV